MNNVFQVRVEITKGSVLKYEYNKEQNTLVLDRVSNMPYPCHYGFIKGVHAPDGDELDVFIVTHHELVPNTIVTVDIVCGFECTDNGVSDDKVVAVLAGNSLPISPILPSIEYFLKNYKNNFIVHKEISRERVINKYIK